MNTGYTRTISLDEGLAIRKTTQSNREKREQTFHAPSGIRIRDPSVREA